MLVKQVVQKAVEDGCHDGVVDIPVVQQTPRQSSEERVDGLCQGRGKLLDFKRNHGLPWLAVHPSLLTLCSVKNQVLAHLIYWKETTTYKNDLNILPKEIVG